MVENKFPGKFIVIEGLDGSGQSTQVKLLGDFLKSRGHDVLITKEPTLQSEAGKQIRSVLDKKEEISFKELQILFAKDRREHLEKEVTPALKKGRIVICDRYFFSSFAYGTASGLSLDWLIDINDSFLMPDIVFFLNTSPETCIDRIQKRGDRVTLFEEKEKLTKVYDIYNILAKRFKDIKVINGEKPIAEVFSEVKKEVLSQLNLNKGGEKVDIKSLLETGVNLADVFPDEVEIAKGNVILRKKPQQPKKWIKFDRDKLQEIEWPINPGTYQIKDPASPVAVVCPAQDAELQAAALNYGAAISGPCITPDRGVELVVTNVISNPNIRWIILAGKDSGHLAGDVLWCLNKYGVNPKTKRVLKTKSPTNPYVMNLPEEAIERFREQVKVINLLGGYNEKETERVKEELGLVIRCCVQEPENAIELWDKKRDDKLILFDPGCDHEPMIIDLSIEKIGAYYEGYHRVGSTIHVNTVSDAYPVLMSHVVNKGSWGQQESTRMALDTVATQAVIHDTSRDLIPKDWQPFGWMRSKSDVEDYLRKYQTWVYLFPLSDVRYDEKEKTCVPYIPDPKQMEYVYGGRLTAYWLEIATEEERSEIRKLVEEYHKKFRFNVPTFDDVVEFYGRLEKLQQKSFNQLYKTAKAARLCVKEGFSNSYRLYMSLQTPPIDVKEDPRRAHNPCFALYEVYPRLIDGEWQLDTCFFLRAHDIKAFPANASGGINIQKFIAWYAGIQSGIYVHHAGSLEVCEYMLPNDILRKYKK